MERKSEHMGKLGTRYRTLHVPIRPGEGVKKEWFMYEGGRINCAKRSDQRKSI